MKLIQRMSVISNIETSTVKSLPALSFLLLMTVFFSSCNYLNIVPDNVPTIDNAFVMRSEAEKFLFTCYSYLPSEDNLQADPAFLGGDECWYYAVSNNPWNIARGS